MSRRTRGGASDRLRAADVRLSARPKGTSFAGFVIGQGLPGGE
ncbi:hypothetical protein [Streptomyces anandii]|uniref:Uncharacterized protein n=1 Tax=Streptomyces anandii TaxID=285454 RepID=A0ABW6H5X9_9ACTN